MVKKDGTSFWARLTATRAQAAGALAGEATEKPTVSRLVLADISERRQVEEALLRSESLLQTTQQLAHVGSWELDVPSQRTLWTEELYHLYGFKRGKAIPGKETITRSLDCFLPEDRPVLEAAVRRCVEVGEPYDLEFRITHAKGHALWIRTLASPVLENGKVVRVTGFVMDITERRLKTGQGKGGRSPAGK
jgi:PAS domain S-box-containing protein